MQQAKFVKERKIRTHNLQKRRLQKDEAQNNKMITVCDITKGMRV